MRSFHNQHKEQSICSPPTPFNLSISELPGLALPSLAIFCLLDIFEDYGNIFKDYGHIFEDYGHNPF